MQPQHSAQKETSYGMGRDPRLYVLVMCSLCCAGKTRDGDSRRIFWGECTPIRVAYIRRTHADACARTCACTVRTVLRLSRRYNTVQIKDLGLYRAFRSPRTLDWTYLICIFRSPFLPLPLSRPPRVLGYPSLGHPSHRTCVCRSCTLAPLHRSRAGRA